MVNGRRGNHGRRVLLHVVEVSVFAKGIVTILHHLDMVKSVQDWTKKLDNVLMIHAQYVSQLYRYDVIYAHAYRHDIRHAHRPKLELTFC